MINKKDKAKEPKETLFELGKLIRRLRTAKGWSLQDLCTGTKTEKGTLVNESGEGICTSVELGRIERGEVCPHWNRFVKIMQRLGENPNKYYMMYALTPNDIKLEDAKTQLKYLLREAGAKKNEEAEALIKGLEQNKALKKDKLHPQYLCRVKAALAYNNGEYQAMYDYALKGIKITRPQFEARRIESYMLFFDEIHLINQIGIALNHILSLEKSIEIFEGLKNSLQKGYVDEDEKAKTYIHVLYNLSNKLGQASRFNECIDVCNEGLLYCERQYDAYFFPLLYFNLAYCFLYLGRKDEGLDALKKSFALFEGLERLKELSNSIAYIEKTFQITYQTSIFNNAASSEGE